MSWVLVIVILIVLVWVHEFGHFIAAKLFGIKVDSFNIGFGKPLFSTVHGETLYAFRPILLGGYVSIHGETGDTTDPRAFTQKSRPVQAAVIVAGILFNLLFAWAVLSGGYLWGLESTIEHDGFGTVTNAHPTVVSVLPGSPAEAVGIEAGDRILTVQTGRQSLDLRTFNSDQQAQPIHDFLVAHQDESIALAVSRGGAEKDFIVKAKEGIVPDRKVLGIELDDVGILRLPPHLALLQAGIVAKNLLTAEVSGLAGVVHDAVLGRGDLNQVSGPIGIVVEGSHFVAQGFSTTITIIALISINLAIINILPIPGLDGGRLLFIFVESIIRRPISPRLSMTLTIAGFALIAVLAFIVSVHDVVHYIG